MESVKHECNELFCKPTSRCYKGISILTGIFALSCLLMAAIIGPVIVVHDGTTIDQPILKPGEPTAAEIKDRLHTMNQYTIWLAVSFIVISAISLALFFKYRRTEQANKQNGDDFESISPL